MLDSLKIAIVCDWLTVYGGAERVILQMHQLFPEAEIFTSLYDKKRCHSFAGAKIKESKLGLIPFARKYHRLVFPLMMESFERFDFSEYDIVLSSSHAVAKGIITGPETLHVSYCHSPARYLWDQSHRYTQRYKAFRPFKLLYRPLLHKIRLWDQVAAQRVDHYIANSHYIAKRIKKYYKRDSKVIHPPVDLKMFELSKEKGEQYLAIGRLVPNKFFDLIVEAFNDSKRPLTIIGDGPLIKKLKAKAKSNIQFLGRVDDETLKQNYQHARALIFPQCEDFGIVPLEAMASGTPVIAYGKGGALETVQEGVSGLFFKEQSVKSLNKTLTRFEAKTWNPTQIHESIRTFSEARFKSELRHHLLELYENRNRL